MTSQFGSFKRLSPSIPGSNRSVLHRPGLRDDHDAQGNHKELKRVTFQLPGENHIAPPLQIPVEARSSEEDVHLLLTNWNSNNKNLYSIREQFLKFNSHIWTIQEGRTNILNNQKTLGYRWHCKMRNDKQLMIGTINSIKSKRREELETENSIIIQIHIGNCQILIGNIHQTHYKSEFKQILEKCRNTQLILGSDLNYNYKAKLNQFSIISDQITRKNKKQDRMQNQNKNSDFGVKIDFIFIHKGIRFNQKNQNFIYDQKDNSLISDHKPLQIEILIKRNDSMQYPHIDSSEARNFFCEWKPKEKQWQLKQQFQTYTIKDLLKETSNISPKLIPIKFVHPKFVEWDEQFGRRITEMERINKKEFHKFIQHSTQIKKEKEGGIINILLHNNQYITNYKEITHLCIEQLKLIQELLTPEEILDRPWKQVRQLSKENIRAFQQDTYNLDIRIDSLLQRNDEYIQRYNKAISFDFQHITPIRLIMQQQFYQKTIDMDLYNLDSWQEQNQYCTAQRLIPLNKIAPNIASIDDMRPIMIQSHLVKFVEWTFQRRFQEIMAERLINVQIGFMHHLGTQVHISRLIAELKQRREKKNATFFDLSNAYNRVNRSLLYQMIKKLDFFNEESLDFLFTMYDELYIFDPITKEKVRFKNGVAQGSVLSPFLFNIYFHWVIHRTQTEIQEYKDNLSRRFSRRKRLLNEIKILAYADDVVIIASQEVIDIATDIFIKTCDTAQLPVNLRKTKYIANKINPKLQQKSIEKVDNFKYLGIRVNVRGNIADQFKATRQAVILKAKRIAFLKKILPFRIMTKIWILYILPLIRYNSIAIWMQSKNQIKKWQTLKRNSFRLVMGLGNQYPKEIIDKIIGMLEVDINHEGFYKIQMQYDLFRKYIWLNEALIKEDTVERRIQFQDHQLLVYFYQFAKKMIDKDLDRPMEESCQTEGPHLWLQFIHRNPEFMNEYQEIDTFVNNIQQRVKQMNEEEERTDKIIRKTNYLIIRRIPGYEYFQIWKHQWRQCTTHNTLMTKDHIIEHLESFHQDFPKRLLNIIKYANDEKGSLVKKVQKSITDQMKEISKIIKQVTNEHCEKYKRVIQNSIL